MGFDLTSAVLLASIVVVPLAGWGAYLAYTRLARRAVRAALIKRARSGL